MLSICRQSYRLNTCLGLFFGTVDAIVEYWFMFSARVLGDGAMLEEAAAATAATVGQETQHQRYA